MIIKRDKLSSQLNYFSFSKKKKKNREIRKKIEGNSDGGFLLKNPIFDLNRNNFHLVREKYRKKIRACL